MAEDHKFQLVSKLVYEILNGAVEEELPLEQAHFVIQDALNVLACKEIKMKVTGFGAGAGGVDDTEETVSSENAEKLVEAKGKILNKLVKKNMIENIVPIIIELKHLLAKEHSPLLGTMMEYLKEMMKEYKDEISDILACDKQLAMELDYDLRMHANKQKAIAAGIAPPGTPVAGVAGTPRRLSIAVDPTTPKVLNQDVANFLFQFNSLIVSFLFSGPRYPPPMVLSFLSPSFVQLLLLPHLHTSHRLQRFDACPSHRTLWRSIRCPTCRAPLLKRMVTADYH
jgi:hypothetical protein